jgi:hypothetical protein
LYKGSVVIQVISSVRTKSVTRRALAGAASTASTGSSWKQPWGEQENVTNHYNELTVRLRETNTPNRLMNITFRFLDDGVGFRQVLKNGLITD